MSKDESYRVYRGGSWYAGPARARVADRAGFVPSYRIHYFGFRLARTVSPLERLAEAGREAGDEQG